MLKKTKFGNFIFDFSIFIIFYRLHIKTINKYVLRKKYLHKSH